LLGTFVPHRANESSFTINFIGNSHNQRPFFSPGLLSDIKIHPEVLYLFEGANYIVTFHRSPNRVIEDVWKHMKESPQPMEKGLDYLLYFELPEDEPGYYHTYPLLPPFLCPLALSRAFYLS
jgi:hypothetical protein